MISLLVFTGRLLLTGGLDYSPGRSLAIYGAVSGRLWGFFTGRRQSGWVEWSGLGRSWVGRAGSGWGSGWAGSGLGVGELTWLGGPDLAGLGDVGVVGLGRS